MTDVFTGWGGTQIPYSQDRVVSIENSSYNYGEITCETAGVLSARTAASNHHSHGRTEMATLDSTIEIPLTKGYVAIVDITDGDLAAFKWQAQENKQTVYAIRTVWYPGGTRDTLRLHRVVLARQLNCELAPHHKVDHRNGNGLDNRRSNLRLANSIENARNRGIQRNSKSGIRGVSWSQAVGKWRTRITVRGVCIDLGYFDDIVEAAAVRREAEILYFGDFSEIKSRLP